MRTTTRFLLLAAVLTIPSLAHADESPLCGSGGDGTPICTVSEITPAVKAALEKERDRAHLLLQFETSATDEQLKTITRLPWLTQVSLDRCDKITDLTPLASLPKLTYVDVSGTGVKSLAPLAKLKNLTELYLETTFVEDLAPLKGLTKLRRS
jgi:Leucine-rich repeat (LRR) protein